MEGALMCRVTAPLAAMFSREAAPRPSLPPALTTPLRSTLGHRLRIARHRLRRWFDEPIAIIERKRRAQDVTLWRYDFRPRAVRRFAQLERATKSVG